MDCKVKLTPTAISGGIMSINEPELSSLQLERLENSGVIFLEDVLNKNIHKEILGETNENHLGNEGFPSLKRKILISDEVNKLLSSSYLKETISSMYNNDLVFVGAKLTTLEANKKSDWSFHSDLYFKQRAFDEGCTLWIPLKSNLNDERDTLLVSILPKHYGFCDPLYKYLHFLEKLEIPLSDIAPNNKHSDEKSNNPWPEFLSGYHMSNIFNQHSNKFHSSFSNAFLCDKLALINFEHLSKKEDTNCILIGLTFYSEHSVFKHRNLEEEETNNIFLENMNDFSNDGTPIIDLPISKNEPFIRIKSGSIDLDKIKEKFDPRICFD